jgi:hypothetical protein
MTVAALERLRGTTAYVEAELRVARVEMTRVLALLDQYSAACASIREAMAATGEPADRETGAGLPGAARTRQYVRQQAAIQAQVRRLMNRSESQLQSCTAALAALQSGA